MMSTVAERVELAEDLVGSFIPLVLMREPRAWDGVRRSELIQYSPGANGPSTTPGNIPAEVLAPVAADDGFLTPGLLRPTIRVIESDTLDAVQAIRKMNPQTRVAALNMASDRVPGGRLLHGGFAQEEALCLRSTLHASLRCQFYRIPTLAGIYSPDVLVFGGSLFIQMPTTEWFYTDVISVAALLQPDLIIDRRGIWVYAWQKDLETMTDKIRLIFQIANQKGITHLVLGALGCGQFCNPPEQVAMIFRRVILGGCGSFGVTGLEEITFAIVKNGPHDENLKNFEIVFADVMAPEA
ncbi:uncharacterized protein L3040_004976 [Drepanopeziza brunnea f. sp. 'multigermtubi']|uniref:uncharacterized protein n=1 Tax=Drepanopeziza brunnea f. sp. 'multigermtubi' TaxID=698441 RepID=UPI002394E593|nr:hypothetical protein L3040_004976 [Drepanopeziza brunnea f. sp. 'multigermtubi']